MRIPWVCLLLTTIVQAREGQAGLDVNYYELLGVSPTASLAEIKKGYRTLALQLHPDKTRELSAETREEAEERFIQVADANTALSDPELRMRYDELLQMGVSNEYSEEIYGHWKERVHKRRQDKAGYVDVLALGCGAAVVLLSVLWALYSRWKRKSEVDKAKKAVKSAALANIGKEQVKRREQEEEEEEDKQARRLERARVERAAEVVEEEGAGERDEEEDDKARLQKQMKNYHRNCRKTLHSMALTHGVADVPPFDENALSGVVEGLYTVSPLQYPRDAPVTLLSDPCNTPVTPL
jgi:curved DNA-binding protein CbpA